MTGLIFNPVVNEFGFHGEFLKLGQNIGLLVGAAFWGVGSDVWGRKYVFPTLYAAHISISVRSGGASTSPCSSLGSSLSPLELRQTLSRSALSQRYGALGSEVTSLLTLQCSWVRTNS